MLIDVVTTYYNIPFIHNTLIRRWRGPRHLECWWGVTGVGVMTTSIKYCPLRGHYCQ